MPHPLRIENPDTVFLITSRTIGSKLWFINNPRFVEAILALLAKYLEIYGVVIYAFILMGNHYHLIAKFPRRNKSAFMRIFNSMFAKAAQREIPQFEDCRLWKRRYTEQALPNPEDVAHWFFYCALNPVFAGLAKNISDYGSYNSFHDAIAGVPRKFELFDAKKYEAEKLINPTIKKSDCFREFTLEYTKLEAFEEKADYARTVADECEARRLEVVRSKKGFPPAAALARTQPGARPKKTKTSDRHSFRPLVLTLCFETKRRFLAHYFSIYKAFKEASARYISGDNHAVFPEGTYRPARYACVLPSG